jgi:predicted transcriptional regulator
VYRGLASQGATGRVEAAMQRRFETAEPEESLEQLLARTERAECEVIPVMQDGSVVGLLTPEGLTQLLLVKRALGRIDRGNASVRGHSADAAPAPAR